MTTISLKRIGCLAAALLLTVTFSTVLRAQQLSREQCGAVPISVTHRGAKWVIEGKTNRVTLNEKDLALSIQAGPARYLGSYPDDLETRLNVGYVAFHIGLWDEAEATADHILRNPERLAEQGFVVAYQNKMMAALARKDFANSIVFAEKCFEIKQTGFFLSVMLLAAAQKGDIEKFKEASHKFQETLPADYEKYKFRIDAAEALALVKNNQEDLAHEIVQRGKTIDRVEGRLKYFWSYYPHGMDIVDNWQRLAKN